MALAEEKQGFRKRFGECLKRQGEALGPARIAREFNLRYHGTPVTPQAVRKWLKGEALPPQDKIRTLAQWLDVSPQWLRFGDSEPKLRQSGALRQEGAAYRVEGAVLARKIEQLNDPHRRMLQEIVYALLRLEGKG